MGSIIYENIGYSPSILNNSLSSAKEEFEAHGATVTISEGVESETHMNQIAEENDLIVYFAHLGAHSPMGMSSFYNEKARYFFHVLTKGAEKSICVSTGSPYIFNDWFMFAQNFVNLYTGNDEIIRTFVKGIYAECEFTGKSPFGLNPMKELVKLAATEKQ